MNNGKLVGYELPILHLSLFDLPNISVPCMVTVLYYIEQIGDGGTMNCPRGCPQVERGLRVNKGKLVGYE